MSERTLFVVPVVIDGTREKGADVPESFLRVQWTHLPAGDTPPAFCERIKTLTGNAGAIADPPDSRRAASPPFPPKRSRRLIFVVSAALSVALVLGWLGWRLMSPKAPAQPIASAIAPFGPPPHSIAVLPFVNMSGDKEQEYFSEGLTEELLNSLARVTELQVAARTSSFSFQGEHPDILTVAHRLNVGAVLEGSVRRSARTVRITAQLVNGVTGFHLWSQTYDRDLGDVLKLQTEIANDVASALKVTLLGDVAAKAELGGTRNSAAFDAYLRALKVDTEAQSEQDNLTAIAGYTEAIRLDPGYALAYSNRSLVWTDVGRNWGKGSAVHEDLKKGEADAWRAIALAPDLANGHMALATVLGDGLEFKEANVEFERALALGSGNAKVLRSYGLFVAEIGHSPPGLAAVRRSVQLDPLNFEAHYSLGVVFAIERRFGDSVKALKDAKALDPNNGFLSAWLGLAYYWDGDAQSASAACETADVLNKDICLALAYKKLGREAEAQSRLARLQKEWGDHGAVFYALIYSEWGDKARALGNLETALRIRQPYLVYVKMHAGFDPLRNEPRFKAIQAALNFPD